MQATNLSSMMALFIRPQRASEAFVQVLKKKKLKIDAGGWICNKETYLMQCLVLAINHEQY